MKRIFKKLTKGERLYYTYRSDMYNAALKILCDRASAEDAVHEAFVRIMKNLHKIDEDNVSETRGFLTIICRNVAIDMYNKRKNTVYYCEEDFIVTEDYTGGAADDWSYSYVKTAVEQLPQIYKDAVILNRIYGYSVSEIADAYGISEDTVKKRITRGKVMLLKILEEGRNEVNTK